MTAATPRASCKQGGARMNTAAKRTMPLGLGIRVLARLWLVHTRLRIP